MRPVAGILLDIVIGQVGYNNYLAEVPAFLEEKDKTDSFLKDVIRNFLRESLAGFSMVILWTVCTYVLLFYMQTYSVKVLKLPQTTGFIASMVDRLCIMVRVPIAGRGPLLSGSAMLILVLTWSIVQAMLNRGFAALKRPSRYNGAFPASRTGHDASQALQDSRIGAGGDPQRRPACAADRTR